jgi:ABC-type transport system substrate-binding protein
MNLALPPFDDVHVRRAVNLAIDKAALLRADRLATGRPATHVVPDALENDLLLNYDPYATRGDGGDLGRAKREMARSRYDGNGDGICDANACNDVMTATRTEPVYRRQAAIVAKNLAAIGIHLRLRAYDPNAYFGRVIAQLPKIPLVVPIAWVADYASASAYFEPLFYGPGFRSGSGNPSLVGAPRAELRRLGYPSANVPSIDSTISQCNREVGGDAFSCWAQADMLLTQRIVPWVPYDFPRNIELVGRRVAHFSWDQSSGTPLPALDRIALR